MVPCGVPQVKILIAREGTVDDTFLFPKIHLQFKRVVRRISNTIAKSFRYKDGIRPCQRPSLSQEKRPH